MITQERVKELLAYNSKTGGFVWNIATSPRVKVGDKAGCVTMGGYLEIGIDGSRYLGHRLAWLYVYGYFPEYFVDHINRDPKDNRIDNLRVVTNQCNLRNRGNNTNNTSGVKGVCFVDIGPNKWQAKITVKAKNIHLGSYPEFIEAACARLAAEQAENWEGCDSSSPAYKYVKHNINGEIK